DGKLLNEAIDRGISFNAEMIFNNIVSKYNNVKEIYGETFIRELSGYDSKYLERNANVPEFQRRIKDHINKRLEDMKKKGLITRAGTPTNDGVKLASISICVRELDNITPKDIIGENVHERSSHYGPKNYGEEGLTKKFSYRDLEIKKTVKTALRRGHNSIKREDMRSVRRKSRGSIYVVYAIDVSGSMKGAKLNVAKKAGIALAYKAISRNDKVGLIAFNSDIVKSFEPMSDFNFFIDNTITLNSSKETNIVHAIERSIELFPSGDMTKHLILITDAVPTVGKADETIDAVMRAKSSNITISVVGVKLTEGIELAQSIVDTSNGNLHVVKNLDSLGSIILEDYYAI
ncbi:MAG: vWA domain-containing protein, partial [Nanoarchaeota archaeon]